MSIIPRQCRAGRALVGLTRVQLAKAARVNPHTIGNFENGDSVPIRATLDAIQRALEEAGVEFSNGEAPGVRWRGPADQA